jgi:Tfp pilus assembly protein PilN
LKPDFDLNLSTRPFPAYRAINVAYALILIVLIVLSAWQAVGFGRYSRLVRPIHGQEQETRVDAESLGQRIAQLGSSLDRPESTAKLNEIGFLNHLILRKDFSWTRLFATLEDLVPDNVHLINLTPDVGASGGITLHLSVQARSIADVTVFIKRVETSPMFENVIVMAEQKNEQAASNDVNVTLTAVYFPQRDVR